MNPSRRIALIDDNRSWREVLADYLGAKGFQVYTAEGARRGLDVLEAQDIRVALIDLHMPEMDGLELLRQLRRRRIPVTVLLMSSDDDPRLPERALAEGAKAFLSKTTAPGLFLRTLLETLQPTTNPARWLPVVVRKELLLPAPRSLFADPQRN